MKIQIVNYLQQVYDFMMKYGRSVRKNPELPTKKELQLRYRLIKEESEETLTALNRCMTLVDLIEINQSVSRQEVLEAITEIADGLADLKYVVFGADLVFGLPAETIFSEVHRSNMTKTVLGHTEIGEKVQKGNYSKPNIASIIDSSLVREKM